jgi:hypothetical protein
MNIVIEGTMATATSPEGIKKEMGLDKFINQVAPRAWTRVTKSLGDGIKSVLSGLELHHRRTSEPTRHL